MNSGTSLTRLGRIWQGQERSVNSNCFLVAPWSWPVSCPGSLVPNRRRESSGEPVMGTWRVLKQWQYVAGLKAKARVCKAESRTAPSFFLFLSLPLRPPFAVRFLLPRPVWKSIWLRSVLPRAPTPLSPLHSFPGSVPSQVQQHEI